MTSEDAYFEKLLLQAGVEENYDAWLNRYLEAENPLSDLVLELVDCGADKNGVISRLNSYCTAHGVDEAEIEKRLRAFLRDRYLSDTMDTDALVEMLYRFSAVLPDGRFSDQLTAIIDYSSLAEGGVISKARFEKELCAFLAEGTEFDCDALWAAGRKKAEPFIKPEAKKRLIVVCIILLLIGVVKYASIENGSEADWNHYLRHFGLAKTEADALRVLGEPLRIDRDDGYTTLFYDGYSLGILGGPGSWICCINVYEKGIMPLRNGIDIGSTKTEIASAYWNAAKMSDADGYILTHRNEHLHDGIWIYLYFDDDDRLAEYHVTNGF